MNIREELAAQLLKELEDLIALAESSAETIDRLLSSVDKVRVALLAFSALTYLFLGGGGAAIMQFLTQSKYHNEPQGLWLLGAGAAAVSLGIGFGYVTYSRLLALKKFRRELRVEQDIHDRLMSMIDSQKRRFDDSSGISPVATATLEIRLRRLDRTDRRA